MTSFSALWQVKNATKIRKTGHTGTLDTFADGLLVVLSGRYTRLITYLGEGLKEYVAIIRFGSETDTLDPDGEVIRTAPLPTASNLISSLHSFTGTIRQRPPLYSAVHVDGKRASDRMRDGETIELAEREVTIHSLELIDCLGMDDLPVQGEASVRTCTLKVVCSKGTYIRSLARDLAEANGSCAHLVALRRTANGPFRLEDAAGYDLLLPLSEHSVRKYWVGEKPPQTSAEIILSHVIRFNPEMATICGLSPVMLKTDRLDDFFKGKKMSADWFQQLPNVSPDRSSIHAAVFCGELFTGVITISSGAIIYEFVAGGQS